MIKVNKYIEIVRSSIPALSSLSQESSDAIFAVLSKNYTRVIVTTINSLSDLEALVARRPDLVFLGMKFVLANLALGSTHSAKIWLTKYLDDNGIAYTGSGQLAHELEFNKFLAKQCVLDAGLMSSPYCVVSHNTQRQIENNTSLTFPLFVKPTNRGGGEGIDSNSVVYNLEQLRSRVALIAAKHGADSLLEEYLPGREFSVAILKDELSEEYSVMPIELIAPPDKHGVRILSKQVKSSDTERAIEVTDENIKVKVTELAIKVFYALGARDYGRIDIRLDGANTPHFLEANLIPSLISGYGSFPKACVLNIGLGYEPMILSIVRLALARNLNMLDNEPESELIESLAAQPLATALSAT